MKEVKVNINMDIQSNLFTNEQVHSQRRIYTPSSFARSSLMYLQESGSLSAIKPHVSSRSNLTSYLVFVVTDGSGWLVYDGERYELTQGSVVFLDCKQPYSQSSSDDLWSLKWAHFYGFNVRAIWNKYRERGGYIAFSPENGTSSYEAVLDCLYEWSGSNSYTRDIHINAKLSELVSLLMDDSWHPEKSVISSGGKTDVNELKEYIDTHYREQLTLDFLARRYYISKSYLARIFKSSYGETVNNYIRQVRVAKAKELLRFTNKSILSIGIEVGIEDQTYFGRIFKKVEGVSPSEYRRLWNGTSESKKSILCQ